MAEVSKAPGTPRFRRWAVAVGSIALVLFGHTVWDYAEARTLQTALGSFGPGYGDPARDSPRDVAALPADGAAIYYIAASSLAYRRNEEFGQSRRHMAIVRGEVEGGALSSTSRDFLQIWLDTRSDALLMLDRAMARPFEGFMGPQYPDVSDLVRLKELASCRAIWQAATGQAGDAARSLVDELTLEGSDRSPIVRLNPFLWSWRAVTAADTQFVLSVSHPDERALRELAEAFAAADVDTQLTRHYVRVRDRVVESDLGRMGRYAESYSEAGVFGGATGSTTFLQRLMRPVAARSIRSKLQEYANLIDATKTPWPGRIDNIVAAGVPAYRAESSLLHRVRIVAADVASIRAARMSVAVERYRRAHKGELPSDARELVPALLPALPIDPFSGSPMVMARTADGYVIYSVGPNKHDDGGKEAGSKPVISTAIQDEARMTGDIGVRIQTAKR